MKQQQINGAVAFAVMTPCGIGPFGWMDMKRHDELLKFLTLAEKCYLIYAYQPTTVELDAMAATELLAADLEYDEARHDWSIARARTLFGNVKKEDRWIAARARRDAAVIAATATRKYVENRNVSE